MTKHVHAEFMAQYAQDALETDKPWERWQVLSTSGMWHTLSNHPSWQGWLSYRRKPSRVQVAGEVFDDVVFGDAVYPQEVFVVRPILQHVSKMALKDATTEFLNNGLVHSTYGGALRHLEALKPKKV